MNKDNTEFFRQTEKWFAAIPDKTENGLRAFLKGERPADAGTSITQKVSNKFALLIYNYDLEAVRYTLRRKFSESAIFDREEIKYLIETFDLDEFQAEAIRFANLLILRNEYVEEGIKSFDKSITTILSVAFKTIDEDVILKFLKEFRKASRKNKTTFVEGIGFSYVERLKQNAQLFIKTPNIGRPSDTENKKDKIALAIKELLKESFGLINESNISDILNGKIPTPKITKVKVAHKLSISRPQFDKWLSKSRLDFEEQVDQVQDEFYHELKSRKVQTKK
jgi:hypothetical protein